MRHRSIWLSTAILVVAAGGLAWYVVHEPAKIGPSQASSAIVPAVPVTAGLAETKNVPVYLTGLGTVQAFNTVVVKVRVDGQLDKVAFTEGQDVKAGDLLAQIDPRPYQAALDQAKAVKAKDEAQLETTGAICSVLSACMSLPRSRAWTRKARWFASSRRRFKAIRPPSRAPRLNSPTARLQRPYRGGSASALSIRATLSMLTMRTDWR